MIRLYFFIFLFSFNTLAVGSILSGGDQANTHLSMAIDESLKDIIDVEVKYVPRRHLTKRLLDTSRFDAAMGYSLSRHCLDSCNKELVKLYKVLLNGNQVDHSCEGSSIVYRFKLTYPNREPFTFYVAGHGHCVYFVNAEKGITFGAPISKDVDTFWHLLLEDILQRSPKGVRLEKSLRDRNLEKG